MSLLAATTPRNTRGSTNSSVVTSNQNLAVLGTQEDSDSEDEAIDNAFNACLAMQTQEFTPNRVPQLAIDFSTMDGGAIHDHLCVKGHGHVANRLLKELVSLAHIPDVPHNKKLISTKKAKPPQRQDFINLGNGSGDGLRYARTYLTTEFLRLNSPSPAPAVDVLDLTNGNASANLKARIALLALDHGASQLLETIFGGATKASRRAMLDDKSNGRTINLWGRLATEWINNPDWHPIADVDDSRVSSIDPSNAPPEPISPEALRSLFSKLRTDYSKAHANFHRSGNIAVSLQS